MISLGPLLPLLCAAGILLAGNGLQGTLIALRATSEGFSPTIIGLIGAAYFAGFMLSCVWTARLIRVVGHIRVFAALASVTAAGSLALVLFIDPYAWAVLRFAMGFSFAGVFMVVESWINESAGNQDRGRVLSIYRLVDLTAVTSAQFLLPVFGTDGFEIFAIMAILFSLSLVPVSLSNRSRPKPPDSVKFDIRAIWQISPVACIGCLTIGMTNGAFRLIGPLYAKDMGLDVTGVAIFMSAGIVGGTVLQFPLGMLSDKFDRRWAVIAATAGASLAGLFLTFMAGDMPELLYAGAFAFGAFALPLYSLSAAHANDHAQKGQYVLVAAGLTLFFGLGAAIGPLVASVVMEQYGAPAFFTYTCIIHASLIVSVLYRMTRRQGVPAHARSRFVTLLRTSPGIYNLARKAIRRNGTR